MSADAPSHRRVWIGTAAEGDARGIYRCELDLVSGALSTPRRALTIPRPTWLALSPGGDHILTITAAADDGRDPCVGLLEITGDGGELRLRQRRPSGGDDPAHVSVDAGGRLIFASNYGDGTVASFHLDDAGDLVGPVSIGRHRGVGTHPTRQAGPHVHSAAPFPGDRFLAVCDLGVDAIVIYAVEPASAALRRHDEVATPAGSGPRRLVWHPRGEHAFVIHELDQTLAAYAVDPGRGALSRLETVSLWPDAAAPADAGAFTAAEVAVDPGGARVFASIRDAEGRGRDRLCVFAWERGRLRRIEGIPAGVACPRHFGLVGLTPEGRWLVAAGMASDSLQVHRVDPASGRLTPRGEAVPCPRPTCVVFGRAAGLDRPRPRSPARGAPPGLLPDSEQSAKSLVLWNLPLSARRRAY